MKKEILTNILSDYNDPMSQKIKESIQKYESLNMIEMVRKAYEGATAHVLFKFNLYLIFRQRRYLYLIKANGEREELPGSTWNNISQGWQHVRIKESRMPIPYNILEKMPNDWSETAVIFYPKIIAHNVIINKNLIAIELDNHLGFYAAISCGDDFTIY